MTTFYIDPESGNDANGGTSLADAWKTWKLGATAARIAPGDFIRVKKSPDPTSIGSCTWTDASRSVTIPSGVIKDVDMCETAWTASANVTSTASTTRRQGSFSASHAIGGGFGTGLASYKALAGSTDFSGYQQLSFWVRSSTALTAGTYRINLCSDAVGAVVVDSFDIPEVPATAIWHPYTVNKGSALGATIQSVALYRVSGSDTPTILLDNIIACKATSSADSLSLTSVFGKNTAAEPWWHVPEALTGTTLTIGATPASGQSGSRTFRGTSETVTTYKRECFIVDTPGASLAVQTATLTAMDAGTVAGGVITYSGGWDTSSMSTQTGETWYSGVNNQAMGLITNGNYNSFEKFGFARYYYGMLIQASLNRFNYCTVVSTQAFGVSSSSTFQNELKNLTVCQGGSDNISILGGCHRLENLNLYAAVSSGISWCSYASTLSGTNQFKNHAGFGIVFNVNTYSAENSTAYNSTFQYNGTGSINCFLGKHYLVNPNLVDTLEVNFPNTFLGSKVFLQNNDQTVDNHVIYAEMGKIQSDATTRHTASGIAWKFNPTVATLEYFPLQMNVAKAYFDTGKTCTVKIWARRSNTSLSGTLFVRGGQLGGPTSDATAVITAIADTWEELTVTWTSASAGVVEVDFYFFGGTTYSGYIDDMTITQA